MIQDVPGERALTADPAIAFWAAGDNAKGEFHCTECGYGVTVCRALPVCPMCRSATWEQSTWSPLTRASFR